jgi:2-iminobutanoate/2-iminopropanoate deaminase
MTTYLVIPPRSEDRMSMSNGGDRPRTAIVAPQAPPAIGPYSHAVRHGRQLYCSGTLPVDPASGELVGGSLGDQTSQCLTNLDAICQAAGTTLRQALRLTIYTTQLDRFAEINEAYAAFFDEEPPARVTVGVAALPLGAPIEIDAIVALD